MLCIDLLFHSFIQESIQHIQDYLPHPTRTLLYSDRVYLSIDWSIHLDVYPPNLCETNYLMYFHDLFFPYLQYRFPIMSPYLHLFSLILSNPPTNPQYLSTCIFFLFCLINLSYHGYTTVIEIQIDKNKIVRFWFLKVFVLLLVCWWSLNCVWVVVGILVALWRCVRKSWRCSVMLWVLLMFSWCFCGVLAVFRWCFGGIEETVFFGSKMAPRTIPNWHQRRCETLLLGLYAVFI